MGELRDKTCRNKWRRSPHHRHGRLQLIPTEKGSQQHRSRVLYLAYHGGLYCVPFPKAGRLVPCWPCTDIMQPKACFSSMPFTSLSLTQTLLFYPKLSHPFYHILACQWDWGSQILPAIWFRLVSHLMKEKEESDGKNGDPNLFTSSAAVWEWFKEAIVGAWHARKCFCHCHSCNLLPSAPLLEIGSLFSLGIFLYIDQIQT